MSSPLCPLIFTNPLSLCVPLSMCPRVYMSPCLCMSLSVHDPVNALCNLSRMKSREVAASLPGRFLSRRYFTLCITMEVEPRIAKQYKCHHCCSCKNCRGNWMEGGKKVSLRRFFADQNIASSWKKRVLGHPVAPATSYCLLPDTF